MEVSKASPTEDMAISIWRILDAGRSVSRSIGGCSTAARLIRPDYAELYYGITSVYKWESAGLVDLKWIISFGAMVSRNLRVGNHFLSFPSGAYVATISSTMKCAGC